MTDSCNVYIIWAVCIFSIINKKLIFINKNCTCTLTKNINMHVLFCIPVNTTVFVIALQIACNSIIICVAPPILYELTVQHAMSLCTATSPVECSTNLFPHLECCLNDLRLLSEICNYANCRCYYTKLNCLAR